MSRIAWNGLIYAAAFSIALAISVVVTKQGSTSPQTAQSPAASSTGR